MPGIESGVPLAADAVKKSLSHGEGGNNPAIFPFFPPQAGNDPPVWRRGYTSIRLDNVGNFIGHGIGRIRRSLIAIAEIKTGRTPDKGAIMQIKSKTIYRFILRESPKTV